MFYLFAASESNIRLHCCKWLHTGAHHCWWQHSGRVCPSKVVAVSAEDKNSAPSSSTAPPASPMSTRRPTTLKTVRCNQLHFLPVLKQKGLRKKTKLARSKFQSRCRVHLGTFTKNQCTSVSDTSPPGSLKPVQQCQGVWQRACQHGGTLGGSSPHNGHVHTLNVCCSSRYRGARSWRCIFCEP